MQVARVGATKNKRKKVKGGFKPSLLIGCRKISPTSRLMVQNQKNAACNSSSACHNLQPRIQETSLCHTCPFSAAPFVFLPSCRCCAQLLSAQLNVGLRCCNQPCGCIAPWPGVMHVFSKLLTVRAMRNSKCVPAECPAPLQFCALQS